MRGRALAVLMSSYYAVMGLSMAGAGILVDATGARAVWALAGMVYLGAAAIAFVLTSRTRDTAGEQSKRNGEPAGFERLRALMSEVEETRRREQGHGTDVALAPDPEGGRAP